jgi:hypothetical protein
MRKELDLIHILQGEALTDKETTQQRFKIVDGFITDIIGKKIIVNYWRERVLSITDEYDREIPMSIAFLTATYELVTESAEEVEHKGK